MPTLSQQHRIITNICRTHYIYFISLLIILQYLASVLNHHEFLLECFLQINLHSTDQRCEWLYVQSTSRRLFFFWHLQAVGVSQQAMYIDVCKRTKTSRLDSFKGQSVDNSRPLKRKCNTSSTIIVKGRKPLYSIL